MSDTGKKIKIKKNLILSYFSDFSGQGYIRNFWPFSAVNTIYGPNFDLYVSWRDRFEYDPRILSQTRVLYFQRTMNPDQLNSVLEYKRLQPKFNYKMVWDMDDLIWGHNELQGGNIQDGIPSYNGSWRNISEDLKMASVEIMKNMDLLCFSTQWLADYAKINLGLNVPTAVIPNTVPIGYWGQAKRQKIDKKIEKPVIIYTGSPTHYNLQDKLPGDWSPAWIEWINKQIEDDTIEFHFFGSHVLPWFIEDKHNRVKVHGWVPIFNLHNEILNVKPHICINPLIPNNFNRGKSDLKFVECAAGKFACVGTVFSDGTTSPYNGIHESCKIMDNCTEKDIENCIENIKDPIVWNSIIDYQDEFIEREGRYTETPQNLNRFLGTILK